MSQSHLSSVIKDGPGLKEIVALAGFELTLEALLEVLDGRLVFRDPALPGLREDLRRALENYRRRLAGA